MIAQVHTVKGIPGPMSEEAQAFGEAAMAEGRSQDGCEASLLLGDEATGEGLVINVFRDEAAFDAFQEFSAKKLAESQAMGDNPPEVEGHVYSTVIALL